MTVDQQGSVTGIKNLKANGSTRGLARRCGGTENADSLASQAGSRQDRGHYVGSFLVRARYYNDKSDRIPHPAALIVSLRGRCGNECCDRLEDSSINVFLRFTRRLELAFRHTQRMIATLDHVQKVWRFHLGSDVLEKIRRTERIARALHKQDRRSQSA